LTTSAGGATQLVPATGIEETFGAAASSDFSKVFVNVGDVSESVGGQVDPVGVDSSGNPLGPYGALLGGNSGSGPIPQGAVSADGSKVFFTVPGDPHAGGTTMLYMRENNQTTTLISQPAAGVSSTPQNATFEGAFSDGSLVFFSTAQQLTADDQNSGDNLYRYDTSTGRLSGITTSSATDPGYLGTMGVSGDGSHVYFVATGQLVSGQGTAGQPNLYVYDTNAAKLGFVATLGPSDSFGPNVYLGAQAEHVDVSADGMHLLFLSSADLTSFGTGGHQEVYEYSAADGSIVCASCSRSGVPAGTDAQLLSPAVPDAIPPEAFNIVPGLRNMSDDGSRVVFEDADALTPDALNDVVLVAHTNNGQPIYAENIYEWERAGTGSCAAGTAGGCVYLIPNGAAASGAWYAGMSASGNDIFLLTRASLTPSDTDGGLIDVYDARLDGGFPAATVPTACQGQACHPASSPASLPAPGSTSLSGPGNSPGSAPAAASFRVAAITAAQRRAFARTGRLELRVTASGPGEVVVTLTAPMRERVSGRWRTVTVTVARTRKQVSRAGTVTVALVLTPGARGYLRLRRSLRVTIAVGYSHVVGAARANVLLVNGGGR
jgi:hypothetical protein